MDIYIISLIAISIFGIVRSKKLQTVLCGILLFSISAFRSTDIGIDLSNYIPYFYDFSNTPLQNLFNSNLEYGYVLFNKIIGSIWLNERFLLITTSAFIIFFISKYIYENSKIPWFSFYLFVSLMFFGSTLNLLRQSMSIVLVLN
ncbi:EpsG family protein, partial [Clostridium sporogenes]|uniref:EpsG family protein n=1 Tax=Clostridium sporogenes TaxID=1509 RepID=UPI00313E79B5